MKNLLDWPAEKINSAMINNNLFRKIWVSEHVALSEKIIEKYADKLSWDHISQFQELSEEFIEKYVDKVNWYCISVCQQLSEDFIEKYADKVDWFPICQYQVLSEEFIEKHRDKIYWSKISEHQKLSEKFIEKYSKKVYWSEISIYQQLSEKFIDKHKNKVYWGLISAFQQLSEEFIEKHKNKVDFQSISRCQHLTNEFIKKYKKCALFDTKNQLLNNHDKRTKKQKLREMREYANKWNLEFNEDEGYLIAYRSHDMWNRGCWNRTIHYDKLKYYRDWHCDLNLDNHNSFGLGIWPKGNIKIQVDVDDWGCMVKGDIQYNMTGKARVWGFTILEIN